MRIWQLGAMFLLPLALAASEPAVTTTTPEGHTVDIFYGKPLVRSHDTMMTDLGATIYPEDRLTMFPDPRLGIGSKITVTRATPVWINDGGNKVLVRTFQTTISDVLAEKGMVLGAKDSIEPAADTKVLADATVTITRVEETELVETKSIAFTTTTKDDGGLFVGQTKTEQEGKTGQKELKYKVRRENGKEVSRELLEEKTVAEPVEKIVLKGTKPLPSLGQGGASWYRHLPGNFAAHRTLPFGSKVLVRSVAFPDRTVIVTINDRGPFIDGRIIDLQAEAFLRLAPLGAGVVQVTLEQVP